MASIQIRTVDGRVKTVPFEKDEIVVGRREGCSVRLPDRNISRRHARFVRRDDGIYLEDLASRYGVFVNEDRIEPSTPLRIGPRDRVLLGDVHITVSAPDDEAVELNGEALEDITLDAITGVTTADVPLAPVLPEVTIPDDEDEPRSRHVGTVLLFLIVLGLAGLLVYLIATRPDDTLQPGGVVPGASGLTAPGSALPEAPPPPVAPEATTPSPTVPPTPSPPPDVGAPPSATPPPADAAAAPSPPDTSAPTDIARAAAPAEPDVSSAAAAPSSEDAGPDPADAARELVRAAHRAMAARQWNEALALIDRAMTAAPNLEGLPQLRRLALVERALWMRLDNARSLLDQGRLDDAETQIREALGDCPADSETRPLLLRLGEDIAEARLVRHLKAARDALAAKDARKALAAARKAVALAPEDSRAKDVLREAEALAKTARAETAPKPEPSVAADPDALYAEALRAKRVDLRRAKKLLEQVVRQRPTHAEAHRELGLVLDALDDRHAAIRHYKRYLDLSAGASDASAIRQAIVKLGGEP